MPDLSGLPGLGFPPPIPGVTRTDAPLTGPKSPMEMIATMLGARQQTQTGSAEKMAQVVQLLREVAREDPRLAELVGGALRVLIEGPSAGLGPGAGGMPPSLPATPVGGAVASFPLGQAGRPSQFGV